LGQPSATSSISQRPAQPSRLFLLHPDSRRRAYKIRHRRNRRYEGQLKWHVGISSSSLVMLDIDAQQNKDALRPLVRQLAQRLCSVLSAPVGLYDSGRGYWLVALKGVSQRDWRGAYLWAKAHGSPFDPIHIEATLKWGRTTLRVSTKENGEQIRRIEIFENPAVHTDNTQQTK
jgi:hypothetical protein